MSHACAGTLIDEEGYVERFRMVYRVKRGGQSGPRGHVLDERKVAYRAAPVAGPAADGVICYIGLNNVVLRHGGNKRLTTGCVQTGSFVHYSEWCLGKLQGERSCSTVLWCAAVLDSVWCAAVET